MDYKQGILDEKTEISYSKFNNTKLLKNKKPDSFILKKHSILIYHIQKWITQIRWKWKSGKFYMKKKKCINISNEQAEISNSKLNNTCLLKMTNTTC